MTINELVQKAHENAKSKGFWDSVGDFKQVIEFAEKHAETFPTKTGREVAKEIIRGFKQHYEMMHRTTLIMLMVTELAEAVEALRNGDEKNHAEELADVMIRIFDYSGGELIDIEEAIQEKMARNKQRPRLHGKRY